MSKSLRWKFVHMIPHFAACFDPKTNTIEISLSDMLNAHELYGVISHEFLHAVVHKLEGEKYTVNQEHAMFRLLECDWF